MNIPTILAGDQFAVRSPLPGGAIIRLRDRIRSADDEATYNHTGILVTAEGRTIEARVTGINYYQLNDFVGHQVIIVRPDVQRRRKDLAIETICKAHVGQVYPWWKLPLYAVSPALAKYFDFTGVPVCSELDAKYEYLLRIRHGHYMGTTPDMLVDEWRKWREYTVVFEDVLRERGW